jgi:hypothetical protein
MDANVDLSAFQCFLIWVFGDGGTIRFDGYVSSTQEKHSC